MGLENEQEAWINVKQNSNTSFLQKFRLYETRSKFYLIGWTKNRSLWRVLKIDRLEATELNIDEDSTMYSEIECGELLKRIHEGNKSTGGLKFVTICYGIVGFIRFLGPYYMLIITKRMKIGKICGHAVYAVTKSEMIPIPSSTVLSNTAYSKNENRYKKLLRMVDLTKDFFFSYSYHVMLSLQRNLSNHDTGILPYETMFVWNEFLTREVRNQLKSTLWTVALVYGFFRQVKLSVSGRDFKFTLIARRSRHYAGTRYLKRGVNEKGRVANDVETEQIVLEDVPGGCPIQISSVVQNRGSIPLFWSQETSRLNIKPDIILSRKDPKYEATKLHFENLVKRYGNPVIILNLIKSHERKPRESILRAEFASAIRIINRDLIKENRLKFLHWDLNKFSKNKATNVLERLGKISANALRLTGFFYFQVKPTSRTAELLNWSIFDHKDGNCADKYLCTVNKDIEDLECQASNNICELGGDGFVKPPMFQKGVLRTNCIDCLDRTNVAQYAYGLIALAHQLHALGFIDVPHIDLDSPLSDELMKIYEDMGDTLAMQYGGSSAHNKIFSERRGHWKPATQSQEFFRTLQRYYSNAYMDAEKQDAINVFLGHFQPQPGKPALWELGSDQHYNLGRSIIKRSLSDGNILCGSNSPIEDANIEQNEDSHLPQAQNMQGINLSSSESTPEISTCESDISYSRYTPAMSCTRLFPDTQPEQWVESEEIYFHESGDSFNFSNFLDVDWLSSSGNSCEEETYERSTLLDSPTGLSSDSVANEIRVETSSSASESGSSLKQREGMAGDFNYCATQSSDILAKFSERFVQWVTYGDVLFP